MNSINVDQVDKYISDRITRFLKDKVILITELKFEDLFTGNLYSLLTTHSRNAGELITGLLDAFLSSSEEKLFGDFLEDLAVFIAEMTCNGHKSTAPGVDLEFFHNNVHFIVSIKSGPNWGNSSQQDKLEQDLKNAVMRLKQSNRGINVQPVLGICYGKTKTSYLRGYLKIVGQNFWYLISENKQLYTDIIEPIGYRAKEHNEAFLYEKSLVVNRFTKLFLDNFCAESGAIDWEKLVQFNSGNFDLDHFIQ